MNTIKSGVALLGIIFITAGCGAYHLGTSLPSNLQTVYVPTFENLTYQPGIDIDITNAVITRFRQDGNLRPVSKDEADTILEGEITDWERRVMGYTGEDDNDVEEYRLYVTVVITFKDRSTGKNISPREEIRGYTDFYLEGSLPDAEEAAKPKAYKDLAKNIVDHVISIW
ncbi:MAG: LptE family protein [Candidatus Auribacterota bacterium]|nr:LptE family protein [Candidatus Auribacterota bacterium]